MDAAYSSAMEFIADLCDTPNETSAQLHFNQRDFFFRNRTRNIVIDDEQPLAGTMVRPQEAGRKQASERGSSVESVIEAFCLKGVQPP